MKLTSGLYYARARHFSPQLGRFLTKDPLSGRDSDGQSLNRYIYVMNNPLRLIDPTGLVASEGRLPWASSSTIHIIVPEQLEVLLRSTTANSTPMILFIPPPNMGEVGQGLFNISQGLLKSAWGLVEASPGLLIAGIGVPLCPTTVAGCSVVALGLATAGPGLLKTSGGLATLTLGGSQVIWGFYGSASPFPGSGLDSYAEALDQLP